MSAALNIPVQMPRTQHGPPHLRLMGNICTDLMSGTWSICKDFMNRTNQAVSCVPICSREHDCAGHHLLSVLNENLSSCDGVVKVAGWSLRMWNRPSPGYPSYDPTPFHLLSTHLTNPSLKMSRCLEIEEFILKY